MTQPRLRPIFLTLITSLLMAAILMPLQSTAFAQDVAHVHIFERTAESDYRVEVRVDTPPGDCSVGRVEVAFAMPAVDFPQPQVNGEELMEPLSLGIADGGDECENQGFRIFEYPAFADPPPSPLTFTEPALGFTYALEVKLFDNAEEEILASSHPSVEVLAEGGGSDIVVEPGEDVHLGPGTIIAGNLTIGGSVTSEPGVQIMGDTTVLPGGSFVWEGGDIGGDVNVFGEATVNGATIEGSLQGFTTAPVSVSDTFADDVDLTSDAAIVLTNVDAIGGISARSDGDVSGGGLISSGRIELRAGGSVDVFDNLVAGSAFIGSGSQINVTGGNFEIFGDVSFQSNNGNLVVSDVVEISSTIGDIVLRQGGSGNLVVDGAIAASVGEVQIRSDGDLTVGPDGSVTSDGGNISMRLGQHSSLGNLCILSGTIRSRSFRLSNPGGGTTLSGSINAEERDIELNVSGDVTITGPLDALGEIDIRVGGVLSQESNLTAQDVSIHSASATINGNVTSQDDIVVVSSEGSTTVGGAISAGDDIALTSNLDLDIGLGASTSSTNRIKLDVAGQLVVDGNITASDAEALVGGDAEVSGALQITGGLHLGGDQHLRIGPGLPEAVATTVEFRFGTMEINRPITASNVTMVTAGIGALTVNGTIFATDGIHLKAKGAGDIGLASALETHGDLKVVSQNGTVHAQSSIFIFIPGAGEGSVGRLRGRDVIVSGSILAASDIARADTGKLEIWAASEATISGSVNTTNIPISVRSEEQVDISGDITSENGRIAIVGGTLELGTEALVKTRWTGNGDGTVQFDTLRLRTLTGDANIRGTVEVSAENLGRNITSLNGPGGRVNVMGELNLSGNMKVSQSNPTGSTSIAERTFGLVLVAGGNINVSGTLESTTEDLSEEAEEPSVKIVSGMNVHISGGVFTEVEFNCATVPLRSGRDIRIKSDGDTTIDSAELSATYQLAGEPPTESAGTVSITALGTYHMLNTTGTGNGTLSKANSVQFENVEWSGEMHVKNNAGACTAEDSAFSDGLFGCD